MIGIVDYGLGNIKAFSNIYKRFEIPHFLVSSIADLKSATKIILPGVGAFDYAMEKLNASGLRQALDYQVLEKKVPVVGICVGMQMMAQSSEEGNLPGLGWIDGEVKKFAYEPGMNEKYPLPHMGWNHVRLDQQDAIFSGFDANPRFYFLHSYYFKCAKPEDTIASADYGFRFSCMIRKENIYGIQCHPEKSHHNGVTLLKNFASL